MNRSARYTLLALAGVFFAPLMLAWSVYHQPAWQPRSGLQQGELLPATATIRLTGSSGSNPLTGHWTLLYRTTGPCDQRCRELLDTLLRVRLTQGKALHRIERVLLTPEPTGSATPRAPDLHIVTDASATLSVGSVYLVDPNGRPVLRYPPGFDPMALVADLHHLLRVAGER